MEELNKMSFLQVVINAGFFSGCLKKERIFIMGGARDPYYVDNTLLYPSSYMYRYCLEEGAMKCVKGIMFYENILGIETPDYVGDFAGLENGFKESSFDRVIVLSGLEMEDNPLLGLRQLYRILKKGGRLDLFLRGKTNLFVKHYLSEYEHKWRFAIDDIENIFFKDKIEKMASIEDGDFFVIEIVKNNDVVYIDSSTPLFSCHIEDYISPQCLMARGYFSSYKDLDEIGIKEMTDKNRYWHNYLDKYEFFLHSWRKKEFNLLELGIFRGASAKMWEKYFDKANIYCVDIEHRCMEYASSRIKPIIMDLGKEDNIHKLRKIKPEIIIDDASHFWDHQIMALFGLFEILPSGGIYIIEDLETSVNQTIFPDWDNGCVIDTYTVLERIIKVTVSKSPENIDGLSPAINIIGRKTEMAAIIRGSCILIKR